MKTDVAKPTEKTPTKAPETTRGKQVYRPLTDIIETEEGVSLMVEMPGVAPDDVDVTLEKRVLTIRGSVKPTTLENFTLAYAEYDEGDFERAFTMSEDFDADKIKAELHNGILTISLPRTVEAKPRKIAVKAS
jgi:HSP20 family molecular chaperone IbpA